MAENRKREQEENREEQEVLQMQQARMEALNRQRDERLKQEKLDSEIARRLAQEDHSLHMLEADNLNSVKGMNVSNGSKYDLTGFKFSKKNQLSDTALLLACKEEFHRRLQIYQQWKNRNQSRQNNDNTCRLPMALLAASSRSFAPNIQRNDTNIQRYFKVPFAKPAHGHMDMCDISKVATSYGMWYAHFDGQWIARQMELHPNKRPLLLVAGRDDLEMCELSLDATQLTRKKGAEISAVEFEQLWHQCGGPSYHLRSNFQKY
ncbi:unnamed protein product [Thelazia callipaeda]|uniref:Myosin-VI_CBD domain-containing protein n=1 Tax=Thelazia callipaeda TaxID=103827 RepID=A0A0N5CX45_THECL|nr:unnamed protein product [Thelazia callipaeda]